MEKRKTPSQILNNFINLTLDKEQKGLEPINKVKNINEKKSKLKIAQEQYIIDIYIFYKNNGIMNGLIETFKETTNDDDKLNAQCLIIFKKIQKYQLCQATYN